MNRCHCPFSIKKKTCTSIGNGTQVSAVGLRASIDEALLCKIWLEVLNNTKVSFNSPLVRQLV